MFPWVDSVYHLSPAWAQNVLLNTYALGVRWHRYGRRFRRAVDRLLEQERWPRERMREHQDQLVRGIVRLAHERSAYYRETMRSFGVRPEDVTGVDDLSRLPLIDRTVVSRRGKEMMTRGRPSPGWLEGHTSGTTGSPLGIWYDRRTCVLTNAVDERQKIWGGKGAGDWIGLFLGRVVVPTDRRRPPFWRVNYVLRQVWFSSFHLSDENLPRYVEEIRRRSLEFLEGYPSTLYILATHLLRVGDRLPMTAVFTSSETLHDVQREAIEEAFQCRIFDFYGHAERTIFAAECELHVGKHVAEEYGYVEVVDAGGRPVEDGETGFLVGTSLHNTAMPMIRYRTGDVSRILPSPCPCGRKHRRIADVTTKAEDIVVTPEGRMISPSVLTHPFKPLEGLVKSQIIQEEPDRVLVKVVSSGAFSSHERRSLEQGLRERLGSGVVIEVREVDDIPRDPSGKYRWVVSKVPHSRRFEWTGQPPDRGEGG